MDELLKEYNKKKRSIRARLREFRRLYKASDEDIFAELSFCILTPQSKAVNCDKAIRRLRGSGLLFKGSKSQIARCLRGGIRFHNNKAGYLVAARAFFKKNGSVDIKSRLSRHDVFKTRDWLVENIKGLGYKEAGHFLRNIGMGKRVAILDVHILRNLQRFGVIGKIPPSLSRRNYLVIEKKMDGFATGIGIPIEELDLLFWSRQTGFIFK